MTAFDAFALSVDMCIGAALVLVGIALGFWLAFRERVNYGRDRFAAGIASGRARERYETATGRAKLSSPGGDE